MPTSKSPANEFKRPEVDATERARNDALLASIGDGVIATDEHARITHINQAALDIIGFKRSDVLHKRFPDKFVAVYENDTPVPIFERPIIQALLTGQSVSRRTIYRKKDGSQVPVQLTVSPITFSRRPIGAVQVFRDVSLEIQDEKLKSDFISIASHQLRTPLSSVNIYTRMLSDGMAGELNEHQKEYTEIVLASVERMNELISTLLNVTRIEAGGLPVNTTRVDLAQLIRQILDEAKPELTSQSLTLTCDIPEKGIVISTDRLLVSEVFANLLTNAMKYTPPEGNVTVSVGVGSTDVTCTVADNGVGIPSSSHKYIFTKFFRAQNVVHDDVSGTGLGLYLTKMICEHLGGEVGFSSELDKGSTFYFSLPLHNPVIRNR